MSAEAAPPRRKAPKVDPRLWVARIIAVAIIAGGIFAISYVVTERDIVLRTDAGEIGATVIPVSAIMPGRVVEVGVANNTPVQAGQVLFRVDPEPYRLRVEQARAALRTAEAAVIDRERMIANELMAQEIADAQVVRAENNLRLATESLQRLENLLPQGFVTAQEVDTARTLFQDAQVTLLEATTAARMAEVTVGTLDAAEAQVELAMATLALAERELANTEVKADVDGIVTGLNLGVGANVAPGVPLFTLIDTGQWRVTAYFRETELRRIRIGAPVDVFLMQDFSQRLTGHVESIGAGIRSQDEFNILGLPVVPSALDWVQVASRFPVEIVLEDPPEALMRVGASAAVVVHSGRD